jgi:hypothetical protein
MIIIIAILIITIIILLNIIIGVSNNKILSDNLTDVDVDNSNQRQKSKEGLQGETEYLDNLTKDRYVMNMNDYLRDENFNKIPLTTQSNMPIEFRNNIKYDKDAITSQPYYGAWHNEKPCSPFYNQIPRYDVNQTDDDPRLKPTYPCNMPNSSKPSKHSSGGNLISNISIDEDIYDEWDSKLENSVNEKFTNKSAEKKTAQANMQNSINELYLKDGCLGDDQMTSMQLYIGDRNRKAINNRTKFDKTSLLPYVSEELEDNENRVWWENENLEQYM